MAKKEQAPEAQPKQQELFAIEGNVANRTEIRNSNSTNVTWLYRIPLDNIKIRPDNFNARKKPEGMSEEMWEQVLMISDLADKIHANNGPVEPILGDFHKDGNFYINDGERRTRALRMLIATGRDTYPNGDPVADVLVLMNPPGTTDLDRKKRMHDANETLPLTIMQKAHDYLSLTLPPHNLTHDQIAALWPRLSRQSVSNYIMAATELPKSIQDAIDTGEVKMTNALADLRKEKAAKKGKKEGAELDEEPIVTGKLADKLANEEKEKAKARGDEDEFEQEDNTVKGSSSKSGPKEDNSSGAHVVGRDSIYMQQQKDAIFKRFFARYHVLYENARKLIVADKPEDEKDEERAAILHDKRHEHAMNNLQKEYDITVR